MIQWIELENYKARSYYMKYLYKGLTHGTPLKKLELYQNTINELRPFEGNSYFTSR